MSEAKATAAQAQVCYSVKEVEQRTGWSRTFLYGLMSRGELPYVRMGRTRRITAEALASLIARNTVGAAGAAHE